MVRTDRAPRKYFMSGNRENFEVDAPARAELSICAACGAVAARVLANYCQVCGKTLVEDYQPLDKLRSSYRLQGRAYLLENLKQDGVKDLFAVNRNPVSETAWASCVYSMVPYVGIVFIPFTILVAVFGLGLSLRYPVAGGAKLSAAAFGLSFVILTVQIFLWWLLYIIPELGRSI